MSRFRTLVRGGLVLVSAGAGAAAISAYYNSKRPDAAHQTAGLFLLDEVRQTHQTPYPDASKSVATPILQLLISIPHRTIFQAHRQVTEGSKKI